MRHHSRHTFQRRPITSSAWACKDVTERRLLVRLRAFVRNLYLAAHTRGYPRLRSAGSPGRFTRRRFNVARSAQVVVDAGADTDHIDADERRFPRQSQCVGHLEHPAATFTVSCPPKAIGVRAFLLRTGKITLSSSPKRATKLHGDRHAVLIECPSGSHAIARRVLAGGLAENSNESEG